MNSVVRLTEKLRAKQMRVHDLSGVGYTDDPDCIAAADLIASQAAEIERLTKERDSYTQACKDLGSIVRHNVSRAETLTRLLAEATGALEPFALISSEGLIGAPGEKEFVKITTQADYFHDAGTTLSNIRGQNE